MRPCLASLVLAAMLGGLAHDAEARSEKTLGYPRDQVWPTAVRFLAVDERLKLIEKDAEAGYVMFELRDEGKTYRGSLEIMTVMRDKQSVVRFVLQIADRPSWQEVAMLTRLERKLRAELGSPAPPPAKDPPKPAPSDPPKDAPKDPKGPPAPTEGGPPVSPSP
jgi:hypothetical protein